jgi:hypothetical protein
MGDCAEPMIVFAKRCARPKGAPSRPERDPSAAVIDSQALKGTGVGGPERGYDGAKRLSGSKRHLLVDTGELVLGARPRG